MTDACKKGLSQQAPRLTQSAQADPEGRSFHFKVADSNNVPEKEVRIRISTDFPELTETTNPVTLNTNLGTHFTKRAQNSTNQN